MDAVHCEFGCFASCAWHSQHLCMSACISEPWATYSKQLTGHEFCIVSAGRWLVRSGVHPRLFFTCQRSEGDGYGGEEVHLRFCRGSGRWEARY